MEDLSDHAQNDPGNICQRKRPEEGPLHSGPHSSGSIVCFEGDLNLLALVS